MHAGGDGDSTKMEQFLREWRQDAFNKAQYDSAIFIGDKLLALTNDDNDAFWMAQVHFATGNYTRAQRFLEHRDLIRRNASCRYLAGHCLVKQGRFDDALEILGDRNPTYLIKSKESNKRKAHPGKVDNGGRHSNGIDAKDEDEVNRRYEAGMCYLRGLCFAKMNAFDRAKECYKDAVRIDVQCFEAFHQLTKNLLLSPEEDWDFLASLDFDSIGVGEGVNTAQEVGNYVQMLYSTQLSKYKNRPAFDSAYESLATHYKLQDNPDLLLARADLLYTQCRYKDVLEITNAILAEDKYNFNVYPVHLACLFELKEKNLLFLVAHDLADTHPEEPCSWLAVGIYYFLIEKIPEARRYFSKASMMDPHFGAAWIGFAHTFAAEREHDQAISAYSTAARLFMGTHLPQVFLGMQNHAMNNMTVAEEFLKTAYGLCTTDPLLLNEMGIVYYHQDRVPEAVSIFRKSLELAEAIESDPIASIAPLTNMGHALRRMKHNQEALDVFDEVLREGGKDAAIFCAKGLIYLDTGRPEEAIAVLHEALAMNVQDPIATDLLEKALEDSSSRMFGTELDPNVRHEEEAQMADFDEVMEQQKRFARTKIRAKLQASPARDAKGKGKGKEKANRRSSLMDTTAGY